MWECNDCCKVHVDKLDAFNCCPNVTEVFECPNCKQIFYEPEFCCFPKPSADIGPIIFPSWNGYTYIIPASKAVPPSKFIITSTSE